MNQKRAINTNMPSLRYVWLLVVCALTIGCETTKSMVSSLPSPRLAWREAEKEDAFEKEWREKRAALAKLNGWDGPEEPKGSFGIDWIKKEKPWTRSLPPQEGQAEFDRGKELYEQEKFAEAEKVFKHVAKKYKRTTIEEEAIFMLAESQFQLGRFARAETSYSKLLVDFPSTRYLERTSARMFKIAQIWLNSPKLVEKGEVQQVDFEDPAAPRKLVPEAEQPFDITRTIPVLPNLTDRSRPAFDTEGRALEALKSIWLNDPTGSLADDALMLTASYHMRNGDYLEADRFFEILRTDYPKSEHFENAYFLGRPVKLASYQGAEYDAQKLEQARQLNENMLRLFPRHPDREMILSDVRKIDEAKAGQEWATIRFYQQKNEPASVAIYCNELLDLYPQSSYADKARQALAELPPEYRKRFTIANTGSIAEQPANRRPVRTASNEEPAEDDYEEETLPPYQRETFDDF